MRRALIALVSAAIAVVGFTTVPAAAASSDRCVTRAEYRKVKAGATEQRAIRVYDTRGKVSGRYDVPGWHSKTVEYRACGGGFVMLDMLRKKVDRPYRITGRYSLWL